MRPDSERTSNPRVGTASESFASEESLREIAHFIDETTRDRGTTPESAVA